MRHRIIFISIIFCVLISAGILLMETIKMVNSKPDLMEINRIKLNSEGVEDFSDFHIRSQYDFSIISTLKENYGALLFSTIEIPDCSLTERINQAIRSYDTILDFERNGTIEGKLIVYTSIDLQGNLGLRFIAIIVPFVILCILLFLYYFYMRHYLYKPFKRLKVFARDVASGNLDLPLPMDKENLFGEFTESFDIMREELKLAEQKAIAEEKSKKELIATLSHDITRVCHL